MKKHYRHENDCLNCGTMLEGKFCHHCGQENLQIKESFGHMMNHAVSDYFHFDHQFFHTLKPLIFQPGRLTNEYMAGRRVQYLHPIKMYIFISIVYFLLLFQSGHELVTVKENIKKPVNTAKILDSVKKEIAKNPDMSVAQKKSIINKVNKYGDVTINSNGSVKVTKNGKNKDNADEDNVNYNFGSVAKDTTYQQYLASQNKLPEDERDGFFVRVFRKKNFSYKQKYGARAKEVFLDEFKHNTPKMMFLLLPLVALMLKLTFWRNKKFYVEHLIYTFHLHCFLFLFLALLMILQMVIPDSWGVMGWIIALAVIYITWYIYRSLRLVYHRSRFRTITKMIGLTFSYFFAFSFCVCVVLLVTALTVA